MARCASRLNHALQKLVGEPKKAPEKQREGQKRDTNQEMLACAFAARDPFYSWFLNFGERLRSAGRGGSIELAI